MAKNANGFFTCRKKGQKMRIFKTSQKNRTIYIYFTADGKRIIITTDDVDPEWIDTLHAMDDEEVNNNRRADDHSAIQLDAITSEDFKEYLKDEKANPLELILQAINDDEHQAQLTELEDAIATLNPTQQDLIHQKYDLEKTNVAIAAEQGVTEAAIRQRFNTIKKNLKNKLSNIDK